MSGPWTLNQCFSEQCIKIIVMDSSAETVNTHGVRFSCSPNQTVPSASSVAKWSLDTRTVISHVFVPQFTVLKLVQMLMSCP